MKLKHHEDDPAMIRLLGILVLFAFLSGFATGIRATAQQETIPPEDLEIIEMLELLENLDFLKEDLDLLKDMETNEGVQPS